MNLKIIKQIAFKELVRKKSHIWKETGNKYYHGERVAALVLRLRKYIIPDDTSHDDILTVSAWFHDIMNGAENHSEMGAKKTRFLLTEHCTKDELREIYDIMHRHDDRYADRSKFSVYAKLHQDADLLDHFGTYDVWMHFLYASHHNENILDVINELDSWYAELETKYRNELNFDVSKKIHDDKTKFIRDFGERLRVEGVGGIWNEEELCGMN